MRLETPTAVAVTAAVAAISTRWGGGEAVRRRISVV